MMKSFWVAVLIKDGTEANFIFTTKKAAAQWIAEQQRPEDYVLKKYAMG